MFTTRQGCRSPLLKERAEIAESLGCLIDPDRCGVLVGDLYCWTSLKTTPGPESSHRRSRKGYRRRIRGNSGTQDRGTGCGNHTISLSAKSPSVAKPIEVSNGVPPEFPVDCSNALALGGHCSRTCSSKDVGGSYQPLVICEPMWSFVSDFADCLGADVVASIAPKLRAGEVGPGA